MKKKRRTPSASQRLDAARQEIVDCVQKIVSEFQLTATQSPAEFELRLLTAATMQIAAQRHAMPLLAEIIAQISDLWEDRDE